MAKTYLINGQSYDILKKEKFTLLLLIFTYTARAILREVSNVPLLMQIIALAFIRECKFWETAMNSQPDSPTYVKSSLPGNLPSDIQVDINEISYI